MLRPGPSWRWAPFAAGVALAVGVVVLAPRPVPPPISGDGLEQIRPGMDRAAVAAVLGGPAGDYRRRPAVCYDATAVVVPAGQSPADECNLPDNGDQWLGDRMLI